MLTLQGVGWLKRKAIGLATVTMDITQYQAPPEGGADTDAPVTHVDIAQTATGGIKGAFTTIQSLLPKYTASCIGWSKVS